MTLRVQRQIALIEWMDNGDMVQRVWNVNEAQIRKVRALLGPPSGEQLITEEYVTAVQTLGIEHGILDLGAFPDAS